MRHLAAAALALLAPLAALGATATTDYTDMWWKVDESGWGANVIQQGDTLFVTVFVYDANREPTWYVAPSVPLQADGRFSGALMRTTGTYYFQQPFDASSVTTATVGNLTFAPSQPNAAVLTYNVGGIQITKNVERLSWRRDDLSGTYIGARQGRYSGCGPALDGKVDSAATIGVTENGDQVDMRDAGKAYTCNYKGKHRQTGHYGEIVGTGVCDDHVNSFFFAREVQVSPVMFSMRYRMEQVGTSCVFEGYVGGIRELP